MKYNLHFISLWLVFLLNTHAYGQEADSLHTVAPISAPKWHQTTAFKTLAAPTASISLGLAALANESYFFSRHVTNAFLRQNYPDFHTKIDDYTVFAPVAAIAGLHVAGIKGRHKLGETAVLYIMSSALANSISLSIKHTSRQLRPDSSTYNSFPSGHTTNAFVAAEMMHQEYKDLSPWYSVAGYSVASATGIMRMLNNRHWLSDVLVGAGFGMVSTKVTYLVYPWLKHKLVGKRETNLSVMPTYTGRMGGVLLIYSIR